MQVKVYPAINKPVWFVCTIGGQPIAKIEMDAELYAVGRTLDVGATYADTGLRCETLHLAVHASMRLARN